MRKHLYFKPEPEAVTTFPDGRERCNKNAAGKREYLARTVEMWERQNGNCAICGLWVELKLAQCDHQSGRGHGGGIRDDRTVVDGQWHNAAVHGRCNTYKASKRYHWAGNPLKYVPVNNSVTQEVA